MRTVTIPLSEYYELIDKAGLREKEIGRLQEMLELKKVYVFQDRRSNYPHDRSNADRVPIISGNPEDAKLFMKEEFDKLHSDYVWLEQIIESYHKTINAYKELNWWDRLIGNKPKIK